jgi:acetylornithine deacetylase/succinyl-diaminopimelate desuccinylase-like protein
VGRDERLADRLRKVVRERREDLIELTSALVREPSLTGQEEGAQRLVAERLSGLGFAVERVEIEAPESGEHDPWGGDVSEGVSGGGAPAT